jgi:predicted ATPase
VAFQVFVSYAALDDVPPENGGDGFVTRLVRSLERHLAQGAPQPRFWRDVDRLRPSDHFDRAIQDGLNGSDVLLVVLSQSWLASEFCRRELDLFRHKIERAPGAKPPVIVAARNEVRFEDRPEPLRLQVGYKVFDGPAIDRVAKEIAEDLRARMLAKRSAAMEHLSLPATPLVGRDADVASIAGALHGSRLVTITGPGGVGKTRVSLACAAEVIDSAEHGVRFVNLAPLRDPDLVPATMLAALGVAAPDRGADAAALVEALGERDTVLLLDNCEHLIAALVPIVAQILEQCPRVRILATSREALHLDGERIYRLEPLAPADAVTLFEQRAEAVAPAFDAAKNRAAVRDICEHLDGIPLAIELAAARVRLLSAKQISERLNERFRLLTGGSRTALPRQQTLSALIAWSYDLLAPEEQSLFRRFSVFRGTFSLEAASAVCSEGGRFDEIVVLDALTSLAEKSLLTVTHDLEARYVLLETIREFAAQKARESDERRAASAQHAAYFAGVAAQAYRDFDSRLPEGWLDRLKPDLDNFRAALHWDLQAEGDRVEGAQIAADCGPMFLRMSLLSEGLRWCEAARKAAALPASIAGRIEYVASMMHTNLIASGAALVCAERAVSFYERSADERGLIRALSQVAQLYARAGRFDDVKAPAAGAMSRARALGEERVLTGVLRRCAFALPPEEIDRARALFAEALESARAMDDPEEKALVLEWWANREAAARCPERAIDLAEQALRTGSRSLPLHLEIQTSELALILGDFDRAEPHARAALTLALETENPIARATAIAYYAAFHAPYDAQQAAMLLGYALERLRLLEFEADELVLRNVSGAIAQRLETGELGTLLERGANWTDDEALSTLPRS